MYCIPNGAAMSFSTLILLFEFLTMLYIGSYLIYVLGLADGLMEREGVSL